MPQKLGVPQETGATRKIRSIRWLACGVLAAAALVVPATARAQYEDEQNFDEQPVDAQPIEQPMPEPVIEEAQPEPAPPPVEDAPPPEAIDNGGNGDLPEEVAPPPPVMPTVRPSRPRPGVPSNAPAPRPRPPRPGLPSSLGGAPQPGAPAAGAADPGVIVDNGPDNGEKATTAVNFDYKDATLSTVIEAIAKLTGRNFDVDPNIGAVTVTIITHDKIPPEMAYQVLESILASRGFSMIETLDGNLIKIVPTPDAVPSPKTKLSTDTKVQETNYDTYSTHIIQVKHADPSELANALKILGSSTARIDVYVPTNTMIITDTADGLRRMFQFLETADIPGQETSMEIYQLTYTRAEIIAQQIEQVLLDDGSGRAQAAQAGRAPQPAPQRAPTRGRPAVPGQSSSQVIGSNEETLRMVTDERLNSLIVVASSGMMEKVRDLVERLDTPTPYEANTLHIYELLNAEAEQVEEALQGLVGGGGSRGGSSRRTSQQRRNTQGNTQQQASTQSQRPTGSTGTTGSNAADVQPFEQAVQITRYDQTNSLLIVCSPQDWKLLESVIARLDVRQRQVHVDAVVMDVTMTDSYAVEVDAAGLENEDYFGLTGTQQISKLTAGLTGAASAANGVTGGEETPVSIPTAAALAGSLIGLGTGGGLTTGVFDDLEFEVDGQEVSVPFVPLLFQAIESITDLEVLSQPSLVTVDNEEASITVGQEIPYVTSQGRTSLDDDGRPVSSGFYGGFNQVQREDIGVKLKVTPQISEGESVLLELEIEISDTDANQIGDVNLLGPTLNKSLVNNKVLVRDGSTAVMAGLIRDSNTRRRAQPPILGDIPVLGWLFRSKSSTRTKRNMVVLVTPTIIKEGQHHDRVTEYKVDEYHKTNLAELWGSKSFFKKVKKKSDNRKNSRPTLEKSEELVGERNSGRFGKGDIKR